MTAKRIIFGGTAALGVLVFIHSTGLQSSDKQQVITVSAPQEDNGAAELRRTIAETEAKLAEAERRREKEQKLRKKQARSEGRKKPVSARQACFDGKNGGLPSSADFEELSEQREGHKVWAEWANAFCRPVPQENGHTNMTHHILQQVKCVQEGLDATQTPSILKGGLMREIVLGLTPGEERYPLGLYDPEIQFIVSASSFDSSALQEYWSNLPEGDVCRDMIVFVPDGVARSCMGIRDREKDCGSAANQCSQMFRPFTTLHTTDDDARLSLFDVSDDEDSLDDKIAKVTSKYMQNVKRIYPPNPSLISTGPTPVADYFRSLFEKKGGSDQIIPFVNEKRLEDKMEEDDLDRHQAYERERLTTLTQRYDLQVGGRVVRVNILRPEIMTFLFHYSFGLNYWKKPSLVGMGLRASIFRDCNSANLPEYQAVARRLGAASPFES